MNSFVTVNSIEQRSLRELRAHPNNARTHSRAQIKKIAKSIQEFGFVNPILIAPDGTIIAGHARYEAANRICMSSVPVIVVRHLSETQRRALVLADNQLALNAGWNDDLLRAELTALAAEKFDLRMIGFDDEELNRMIAEQEHIVEAEIRALDNTDSGLTPRVSVSQPGDLWILGPLQLSCGDDSNPEVLEFADKICRQWQQATGKPPVLDHNKRSFRGVAVDRRLAA